MTHALALVLAALLATAGCQTMTGRSAGQWANDRAVTAKVKARLAVAAPRLLTRVHVDTYEGVVYLTGGLPTSGMKQRAEDLARTVTGVRQVVSNLYVADAVAASPPTERAASARDPLRAQFPGITRLETESGTPGWTRYAAYEASGRRIATVYAINDGALAAIPDLGAGGLPIDHVSLIGGAPRYVVLWHLTVDEVSRLR